MNLRFNAFWEKRAGCFRDFSPWLVFCEFSLKHGIPTHPFLHLRSPCPPASSPQPGLFLTPSSPFPLSSQSPCHNLSPKCPQQPPNWPPCLHLCLFTLSTLLNTRHLSLRLRTLPSQGGVRDVGCLTPTSAAAQDSISTPHMLSLQSC